ncbi:MAG: hypothetical protein PHZ07_00790 [Patescibacteria group bacterium]|nr:hypothetical protein [Patescibacteria group bacterium]MDD4304606.1 hypothetical protein [Patescibacteria group bacterium]MDD4695533.1 hypothetical protein [Patescibacteria group bacterium]
MNIDKILDTINDIGNDVIIAKDDKPLAVLMSLDRYRELLNKKEVEKNKIKIENNFDNYVSDIKRHIISDN